MDGPVGSLTLNVIAGFIVIVAMAAGGWLWRRNHREGSTSESQKRIEKKLDEIRHVLGTDHGQPIDVEPLASAADSVMEAKIDSVLELQEQGRYKEAIEALLSAYSGRRPIGAI